MATTYYTAASIDGFLADEQGSLDWLFQFGEVDGMGEEYPRFIRGVGALAMGATTYEWILRHENLLAEPAKWPYAMPAWVFTHRRLPAVPHADIRFVRGDVAPVHAEMVQAAHGRDVWLAGGGNLVGQFADAGLLDEVIVSVASVFLGRGAPLLPRHMPRPLRLTDVRRFGEAFAVLEYAVDNSAAGR